jgi:hypothetical protein
MNIDKDTLHSICLYILNGMTEREACVLADFSYNELQNLKEESKTLREIIEKKHIEFKLNHLKEIQKNKSEKNSIWMLEKLRPEEFGAKARGSEAPTVNIINAIIKDIQNDNQGIVKISRGTVVHEQGKNESDTNPKLAGSSLLK